MKEKSEILQKQITGQVFPSKLSLPTKERKLFLKFQQTNLKTIENNNKKNTEKDTHPSF